MLCVDVPTLLLIFFSIIIMTSCNYKGLVVDVSFPSFFLHYSLYLLHVLSYLSSFCPHFIRRCLSFFLLSSSFCLILSSCNDEMWSLQLSILQWWNVEILLPICLSCSSVLMNSSLSCWLVKPKSCGLIDGFLDHGVSRLKGFQQKLGSVPPWKVSPFAKPIYAQRANPKIN